MTKEDVTVFLYSQTKQVTVTLALNQTAPTACLKMVVHAVSLYIYTPTASG